MTIEQAKQMYLHVFPDDGFCGTEWEDICNEMEAVASARTDEDAAAVIRWWHAIDWQDNYEAIMRDVRKLRRYAKKHNL